MSNLLKKFLNIDKLSKYEQEQKKRYKRYVKLGTANTITFSKSEPEIYEDYMQRQKSLRHSKRKSSKQHKAPQIIFKEPSTGVGLGPAPAVLDAINKNINAENVSREHLDDLRQFERIEDIPSTSSRESFDNHQIHQNPNQKVQIIPKNPPNLQNDKIPSPKDPPHPKPKFPKDEKIENEQKSPNMTEGDRSKHLAYQNKKPINKPPPPPSQPLDHKFSYGDQERFLDQLDKVIKHRHRSLDSIPPDETTQIRHNEFYDNVQNDESVQSFIEDDSPKPTNHFGHTPIAKPRRKSKLKFETLNLQILTTENQNDQGDVLRKDQLEIEEINWTEKLEEHHQENLENPRNEIAKDLSPEKIQIQIGDFALETSPKPEISPIHERSESRITTHSDDSFYDCLSVDGDIYGDEERNVMKLITPHFTDRRFSFDYTSDSRNFDSDATFFEEDHLKSPIFEGIPNREELQIHKKEDLLINLDSLPIIQRVEDESNAQDDDSIEPDSLETPTEQLQTNLENAVQDKKQFNDVELTQENKDEIMANSPDSKAENVNLKQVWVGFNEEAAQNSFVEPKHDEKEVSQYFSQFLEDGNMREYNFDQDLSESDSNKFEDQNKQNSNQNFSPTIFIDENGQIGNAQRDHLHKTEYSGDYEHILSNKNFTPMVFAKENKQIVDVHKDFRHKSFGGSEDFPNHDFQSMIYIENNQQVSNPQNDFNFEDYGEFSSQSFIPNTQEEYGREAIIDNGEFARGAYADVTRKGFVQVEDIKTGKIEEKYQHNFYDENYEKSSEEIPPKKPQTMDDFLDNLDDQINPFKRIWAKKHSEKVEKEFDEENSENQRRKKNLEWQEFERFEDETSPNLVQDQNNFGNNFLIEENPKILKEEIPSIEIQKEIDTDGHLVQDQKNFLIEENPKILKETFSDQIEKEIDTIESNDLNDFKAKIDEKAEGNIENISKMQVVDLKHDAQDVQTQNTLLDLQQDDQKEDFGEEFFKNTATSNFLLETRNFYVDYEYFEDLGADIENENFDIHNLDQNVYNQNILIDLEDVQNNKDFQDEALFLDDGQITSKPTRPNYFEDHFPNIRESSKSKNRLIKLENNNDYDDFDEDDYRTRKVKFDFGKSYCQSYESYDSTSDDEPIDTSIQMSNLMKDEGQIFTPIDNQLYLKMYKRKNNLKKLDLGSPSPVDDRDRIFLSYGVETSPEEEIINKIFENTKSMDLAFLNCIDGFELEFGPSVKSQSSVKITEIIEEGEEEEFGDDLSENRSVDKSKGAAKVLAEYSESPRENLTIQEENIDENPKNQRKNSIQLTPKKLQIDFKFKENKPKTIQDLQEDLNVVKNSNDVLEQLATMEYILSDLKNKSDNLDAKTSDDYVPLLQTLFKSVRILSGFQCNFDVNLLHSQENMLQEIKDCINELNMK